MKRNLVRLIAGSGFAFAALCAGSAAEPVRVAPIRVAPIRVAPVYGAGLSMPEFTLLPGIALPGWSFRGSSGGMEADADGWRAFRVRTSGKEGAPTLEGRARFLPCPTGADSVAPDPGGTGATGAVRAEWRVVPTEDVDLLETFVSAQVPGSAIAGGCAVVDGNKIPIALDGAKGQLFRGPAAELALVAPDGSEFLHVSFDKPTAILLQDGAHWGSSCLTIRLFLAEGALLKGSEYSISAAFSVPASGPLELDSGDGVTITAGKDWIPLQYDSWIEPGSALDFTQVLPHHAPAGKFGRVVAVGDHFEFENLPGVAQRFYGVNLCGTANLPSSREAADRFAANVSRIGYNAIRIHHHERTLLADDGRYRPGQDDTVPSPGQWEKFDDLVAACVANGLYLTTDLFVSRSHSTPWRSLGIDRDGCITDTGKFKMLCAFWEPAFSNLCAWSRNFLLHVNPRTGRSLAEEPALATLALVNEGNLGNWGGAALRDIPGVGEAWTEWLAANPGVAAAAAGGDGGNGGGVLSPERLARIPDDLRAVGDTPEGRHAGAFALFLAERETSLFERLAAFVRDECGCRAPLSSLSSWYNPVQYQLPRSRFDYVDDHFYVDHPVFLDRSWALPSRCENRNPVAGPAAGAKSVEWRRLMDKPFCLTEWNYSGPGRFRGVGGIATGALGALQNWSGMWRFAWSHGRPGVENPETKSLTYFDMSGDPLGLAAERAALCLFLRRDLAELPAEYPLVLDEGALRDPRTGAPYCEIPAILWAGWHAKVGSVVESGADAASGVLQPGRLSAALDTTDAKAREDMAALGAAKAAGGAISIDPLAGTFLIDTPRTAGGFAESGAHSAGSVAFTLLPGGIDGDPDGGSATPATVWVSSLDGKPIPESSHMLLTHLTDVQNSGIRYGDPGLTILLGWGGRPHLARRGAAAVSIAVDSGESAGPASFTVYRLDTAGRRVAEVPAKVENGRLDLVARTDIDPSAATILYELVRDDAG